jgi:predicted RNA methylase
MTFLLKAQVKHGAAADLFGTIPTEVHVKGHLRADTHGARFVLPYVGVRHKAPAKPLPEVDLPLFVVRAPPPPPPEPLLIITPEPPAPSEPLLVIKRKAQSGKLRDAADKIIAAANESLGRDRQANTRKRVQQAASSIADAQRDERIGQTMRNLADAIEAGEAKALAGITSRAAVEALDEQAREARVRRWRNEGQGHQRWEEIHAQPIGPDDVAAAVLPVPQLYRHTARGLSESGAVLGVPVPAWLDGIGEDDRFRPTEGQIEELKTLIAGLEPKVQKYAKDYSSDYKIRNAANHARWDIRTVRELITKRNRFAKMGINSDEDMRAALAEYIQHRGGLKRENPITKMERDLVGKRPGIDFFPTPPTLAKRMVELAGITPGMHVLEPSAGKGDIADALKEAGAKVDALEISSMLRPILEAKGHHLAGSDFMAFGVSDPAQRYDAVVMNPPWSGGADVRHVMRAWDMVKPGGRLVALMSVHASFASDNQSKQFRDWLEAHGASTEKLPSEAFKSQWMPGGIASWLVSVDKPADRAGEA